MSNTGMEGKGGGGGGVGGGGGGGTEGDGASGTANTELGTTSLSMTDSKMLTTSKDEGDADEPPPPQQQVDDETSMSVISHARPAGDWESVVPTIIGEPVQKESWSNQLDFLMTCISMSVGFGNIYRFPFVAFANGGGAFLVPYMIVMFVVGRPMYFFELLLGQFTSMGCVGCWEMAPFFRGIGYTMVVASAITVTFYSTIMATVILYCIYSFWSDLLWARCRQEDLMLDGKVRHDVHCEKKINLAGSLHFFVPTTRGTDRFCVGSSSGCTEVAHNASFKLTGGNGSDAEMFFRFQVMKSYINVDDGIGKPDLWLALCLLITWLIIFGIVKKGITGSGKIAWFTALFPYLILGTLFVVAIRLDNAIDGIVYFFNPQWEKLLEVGVWFQAIQQCFFSLGMGFGPVIVFGGFNDFRHKVYRDVWIVGGMDAFTSILAGSTIFAILGNLADGREISTVVESGPNIAFVSYPSVMKDLGVYPLPQILSFLFFFMLLVLGLGSGTSMANTVVTVIQDAFPRVNNWFITVGVCVSGFFVGLLYITPGGSFMVLLVDTFGSSLILYAVVLTEMVCVSWVYGLRNFCNDVEYMLGAKLNWYWKTCWGFVIPAGLLFVLTYNFMTFKTPKVGDSALPSSAIICGAVLSIVILSIIPITGFYVIATRKTHSAYKKIRAAFHHSIKWGPKDPATRDEWEELKATLPYRYHPWKLFSSKFWRKSCPCFKKPALDEPEPEIMPLNSLSKKLNDDGSSVATKFKEHPDPAPTTTTGTVKEQQRPPGTVTFKPPVVPAK